MADSSRYGGNVPRGRTNTPERVVLEATPTIDGHLIPRQTARANGYGLVRIGGRLVRAHRAAWEAHHGRRLPRSKVVRHRCQVRACIEPTHLLSGSQRQNVVDAARAGQLVMPYGVRLDPVLVRRLRREHARGRSFAELGREIGVQAATIRFAVRRQSWAWVR